MKLLKIIIVVALILAIGFVGGIKTADYYTESRFALAETRLNTLTESRFALAEMRLNALEASINELVYLNEVAEWATDTRSYYDGVELNKVIFYLEHARQAHADIANNPLWCLYYHTDPETQREWVRVYDEILEYFNGRTQ